MIQQIADGHISTETHQGITTIEFAHPKGNSLPGKLLEELAKEIHFAGTHNETKVIILKSSGDKTFCAGASFDELISIQTEAQGAQFFSGFGNLINAMRKCPKFIIGRIHGSCVGGGVGLVAALDYAIALDKAEVKLSELSIGIGPFVVGPAIEKKIGSAAFSALAIDATKWRNSDWGKRKGLFSEVHESVENMDESINNLAHNLAHSNPAAMKEMKAMFWKGTDDWDELLKERAAISGHLALSSFTRHALEKFHHSKTAKAS